MVEETVQISVDSSEIDATVAKLEAALDKKGEVDEVKDSAEAAKGDVEEVTMSAAEANAEIEDVKRSAEEAKGAVDEVAAESEGTDMASRRLMTRLPGLREMYHYTRLLKMLFATDPFIGAILLLFVLGGPPTNKIEDLKKTAKEYQKMVMEYRGLTTKSQFDTWQAEDQRRTSEAWRSGVIL